MSKISNRFWLAGIIFNLVHALLKVSSHDGIYVNILMALLQAGRLADEVKALRSPRASEKLGDDAERDAKYHALQK